jgi:hypothetical protein
LVPVGTGNEEVLDVLVVDDEDELLLLVVVTHGVQLLTMKTLWLVTVDVELTVTVEVVRDVTAWRRSRDRRKNWDRSNPRN